MKTFYVSALTLLMACGGGETDGDARATAADTVVRQTQTLLPAAAAVPDTSDIGLPTTQLREASKIYPVDEAPQDPSFVAFRQNLLDAVERRDAAAVERVVGEDISYSFGADAPGRAGFLQHWGFGEGDGPGDDFYHALGDVLRGGGVWQDNGGVTTFSAPYTYSAADIADPLWSVIVTGQGVNVRERPSTSAPILTQLSYEVAAVPEDLSAVDAPGATIALDGRDYGWTPVELPGGQIGYIVDKYARRPADYRAFFQRVGGEWKMTVFITGD